MAYATNNLMGTAVPIAARIRATSRYQETKTFATDGAGGTLAVGTPVAYDTAVDKWKVWSGIAAVNEVQTITIDATGGTFTVTYDGVSTAALAWNISAANLKIALAALPGLATADLTVALASLVYTITFAGALAGTDISVLVTGAGSLTGGAGTATVATSTAGVSATGKNVVRGFVFPDAIVLDATNDVLGVVMLRGGIHYDDIVLPAGESANTLKAALREGPRSLGLDINGLSQVR